MAKRRRTKIKVDTKREDEGQRAAQKELVLNHSESLIRLYLKSKAPGWVTVRDIVDFFYAKSNWTPRNCAAWVTHLRRQGRPWLVAEQRNTGRIHPLTKKDIIVWSYRLADEALDSPFLEGLDEIKHARGGIG